MNKLFEIEPSLSPRLQCMQTHHLRTKEFPDNDPKWMAWREASGMPTAFGNTEEEALDRLLVRLNIPHYAL